MTSPPSIVTSRLCRRVTAVRAVYDVTAVYCDVTSVPASDGGTGGYDGWGENDGIVGPGLVKRLGGAGSRHKLTPSQRPEFSRSTHKLT